MLANARVAAGGGPSPNLHSEAPERPEWGPGGLDIILPSDQPAPLPAGTDVGVGILTDFERRLEGAIEGIFTKAFRSGVQPVQQDTQSGIRQRVHHMQQFAVCAAASP